MEATSNQSSQTEEGSVRTLENSLAKYFGVPAARKKPDPSVLSWRGKQAAAAKKVKKLLAQYPSIEVEDDCGQFWVFCNAFDPDDKSDPLYDAHFATGWEEVLTSVEVYVAALKAQQTPPGSLGI